ncbi:MAG: DNA repair protein RecN [Ferruginibacter sp.]
MLQKLHIRNYAIIDDLQVNFTRGLNIITGETGAGKSILMGALNLILGSRADASSLSSGSGKLIVEGFFKLENNADIESFFVDNDLDKEDEIILRREISSAGKSRAFINDTPVNLTQLRQLGLMLVDLHQQFDTLDLASQHFQSDVLDAMAGNLSLLSKYRNTYQQYAQARKLFQELEARHNQLQKEQDYNQHLFDELEALSLRENEIEETEEALKLMTHAENIKEQLNIISDTLLEGESPLTNQLKILVNQLKHLESYHAGIAVLSERLSSATIELDDIAGEIYQVNEKIVYDPAQLEALHEKLSPAYKLLKKHAVQTTADLLSIKNGLEAKLEQSTSLKDEMERVKTHLQSLYEEAFQLAEKLSLNRKSTVAGFTKSVHDLLFRVGMPGARIHIEIINQAMGTSGIDNIRFLFDANKTGKMEPLQKVASGGELSRLMLSIKSLVAKKLQLPTLIFDEIDTGISGEAARQAGLIMKDLSGQHQTIAITHQPQIAARADYHLFVFKEKVKDKMVTSVIHLQNDERVLAIAKMLSGEKPTAAALQNAREMVNN